MLEDNPVANRQQVVLVNFSKTTEAELEKDYKPLTLALALGCHQSQYFLAFNRSRDNWEIPGGHIQAGESARQAALRELFEETGQQGINLRLEGVLQLRLPPDHRLEYAAFFTFDLPEMLPFSANSEISHIVLWDGCQEIGEIDSIDRTIIGLTGRKISEIPACGPSGPSAPIRFPLVMENGARILDFLPVSTVPPYWHLNYAQVLAAYRGRYLQVYVNRRRKWEFPGGAIEKGESWPDCAIRETREESGQDIRQPRLAGILKAHFSGRNVFTSGALVIAELADWQPFQANEEIADIRLCDPANMEELGDCFNRTLLKLTGLTA